MDYYDVDCPACNLGMMVDADAALITCDECGATFDATAAKVVRDA